jgi:hypothetical protein
VGLGVAVGAGVGVAVGANVGVGYDIGTCVTVALITAIDGG